MVGKFPVRPVVGVLAMASMMGGGMPRSRARHEGVTMAGLAAGVAARGNGAGGGGRGRER